MHTNRPTLQMRKGLINVVVLMMGAFVVVSLFRINSEPPTEVDTLRTDDSFYQELRHFQERLNLTLHGFRQEMTKPSQPLPTIYVITPTYKRYTQLPELTRLGQTLLNVPKLHWIIAEDSNITNEVVLDLLRELKMPYTYLLTPMPDIFREPKYKAKPKGVANRNGAMNWIRTHASEGVFYLADDDNTYDIRLFEEIRYTKKVSMLPVGFLTSYGLSTPIVKEGKFAGWYDGWIAGRKFPIDMAGFAVSVPFFLTRPKAKMPYSPGYEETGFLESLDIKPEELEFVANNCTKIYAWHTKTQKVYSSSRDILQHKYNDTNLRVLQNAMVIKKE